MSKKGPWQHAKSKLSVLLKNRYINALRGVPIPNSVGEKAQSLIAGQLSSLPGALIGRIGATEGKVIRHYLHARRGRGDPVAYPLPLNNELRTHSGFFDPDDRAIDRFAELYLRAAQAMTLRALWTPLDRGIVSSHSASCRLLDLDPFFARSPWTLALEGRRVTVISPFARSIHAQFEKRELLFLRNTMPAFHLRTVIAPQTHCEQDASGQDWFVNLDSMVQDALDHAPEIVIIGAGAYGLPAAAALSCKGIRTLVLGGATQLLFGIRGRRWENDRAYARLMNSHWTRPAEEEQPKGFRKLEINGGAYW